MFGKRGNANPHWKGGVTPKRQAFYLSPEWKKCSQEVWRRDRALCRRCGLKMAPGVEMHIHHKVSFAYRPLRAAPQNLVLLCDPCHDWVHSRKNKSREWIEEPQAAPNKPLHPILGRGAARRPSAG
jgi:5-methylcytosine-specific restriction endonuclease McrA